MGKQAKTEALGLRGMQGWKSGGGSSACQSLASRAGAKSSPPSRGEQRRRLLFFLPLLACSALAAAEADPPAPFHSKGALRVSRIAFPAPGLPRRPLGGSKGGRRRSFRKREAGREEEAGRRSCYQAAVLVGPFAGGARRGDRSPKGGEKSWLVPSHTTSPMSDSAAAPAAEL